MAKIVETKHIFPRALDIHQELIIIFIISFIEDLCNGSTPDSDSVCGGSNPSSSANTKGTLWGAFCISSGCRKPPAGLSDRNLQSAECINAFRSCRFSILPAEFVTAGSFLNHFNVFHLPGSFPGSGGNPRSPSNRPDNRHHHTWPFPQYRRASPPGGH